MKFGASVWPFTWDTPYDVGIRRIAKLGFKAIELIAWDREALDSYYTPATIKHLRGLLADEGLLLSEFVSTPRGMASPDFARTHGIRRSRFLATLVANVSGRKL